MQTPSIDNLHIIVPNQGHLTHFPVEEHIDYEERDYFHLIKLQDPQNTLVFVTSRRLDETILAYYLKNIPNLPEDCRSRLFIYNPAETTRTPNLMLRATADESLIETIKTKMSQAKKVYFHCEQFESQAKGFCEKLGIAQGRCSWNEDKSRARTVFEDCNLPMPKGTPVVNTLEELIAETKKINPAEGAKWFLKANSGLGNVGNAVWSYPQSLPSNVLEFKSGFVAEEWLDAPYKASPSLRYVITDRDVQFMGAGEELFSEEGEYIGAESANEAYVEEAKEYGFRVARRLMEHGVQGAFCIGFCAISHDNQKWSIYAVDLNVREGGESWVNAWKNALSKAANTPKKYRVQAYMKKPGYYKTPSELINKVESLGTAYTAEKGEGVILYKLAAERHYGMAAFADSMKRVQELFATTHASIEQFSSELVSELVSL